MTDIETILENGFAADVASEAFDPGLLQNVRTRVRRRRYARNAAASVSALALVAGAGVGVHKALTTSATGAPTIQLLQHSTGQPTGPGKPANSPFPGKTPSSVTPGKQCRAGEVSMTSTPGSAYAGHEVWDLTVTSTARCVVSNRFVIQLDDSAGQPVGQPSVSRRLTGIDTPTVARLHLRRGVPVHLVEELPDYANFGSCQATPSAEVVVVLGSVRLQDPQQTQACDNVPHDGPTLVHMGN